MTWLIIAGVVMAIMGSVFWLKPSARDARLADLRFNAIRSGMQVRQFTFKPDAAKTGVRDDITATSYTWLKKATYENGGGHEDVAGGELQFSVVRQPAWDQEFLPQGLSWHDKGDEALARKHADKLAALLPELSDELLMLEVYERRVLMMTAEKQGANAEQYLTFMQALLSAD